MRVTPLSSIEQLGKGTKLEAVSAYITDIGRTIRSKPDSNREWLFTIVNLNDNGCKLEGKIWGRTDRDLQGFKRKQVNFICDRDKSNKPKGLEVDEDRDRKPQLCVYEGCDIEIIDGDYAPDERDEHQDRRQQRQPSRPPQREPYRDEGSREDRRPHDQPRRPQPTPRVGANVGMALNNAVSIIKGTTDDIAYFKSAQFGRDLLSIAGTILRASDYLEAGNLPPKPNDGESIGRRTAGDGNAHAQPSGRDQRQEQHHERQEETQQETRQPPSQPTRREQQAPASQEYIDEGLDNDEIPF